MRWGWFNDAGATMGLEDDHAWDPVEYKEFTRETWDYASSAYIPFATRYLEPYGQRLLELLQVPSRATLLDVASGAGEPALTLAHRMGAGVKVTGCDLSPKMVALANAEAKRRKVDARFHVEDAEKLSFPDASFDAVTCRFGLQIFTDPDAALAEMKRVLKPGGQLGIAVWGLAWRAEAIDVLIGAIIRHTAQPEYIPTPFEFGNVKELAHALTKAGFRDVRDERVTIDLTFDSPEQYLEAFRKATPLGPVLDEHPKEHVANVVDDVRRTFPKFRQPDGTFRIPNEAVLAVARK